MDCHFLFQGIFPTQGLTQPFWHPPLVFFKRPETQESILIKCFQRFPSETLFFSSTHPSSHRCASLPTEGKAPRAAEILYSRCLLPFTSFYPFPSGEACVLRDQRRLAESTASSHLPPRDPVARCVTNFSELVVAASVRVPGPLGRGETVLHRPRTHPLAPDRRPGNPY